MGAGPYVPFSRSLVHWWVVDRSGEGWSVFYYISEEFLMGTKPSRDNPQHATLQLGDGAMEVFKHVCNSWNHSLWQ